MKIRSRKQHNLLFESFMSKRVDRALRQYGIVHVQQLYEMIQSHPKRIEQLTGQSPTCITRYIKQHYGNAILKQSRGLTRFKRPPLTGLANGGTIPHTLETRRDALAQERKLLCKAARRLVQQKKLPLFKDLTAYLPEAGNQGYTGSCVGWGSTAARAFLVDRHLSSGYAWRGAKFLDNHPEEDSTWLEFAFEYFYLYGHLEESIYPYQYALEHVPVEPYQAQSAPYKIDGFIDLIVDEFSMMPTLLKGILSGMLIPEIGPSPVAIGVALYESSETEMVNRSGMFTLPLPGERRLGGHAMAIVGYIDTHHPKNPFGQDYFIVRNSWGTEWARENPLGYCGHALVPQNYFANNRLLHSAIMGVAEISPCVSGQSLYVRIRDKTRAFLTPRAEASW